MLRSMLSGVSGLRTHQTRMDVIGNNIANVNTVAFKGSRVNFQEIFSQTLNPASSPANGRGGSNPTQVGLGVSLATIDVLHTNGSTQVTDKATDLSIDGDGFFVVSNGSSRFYTRAGNLNLDQMGNLVHPSGLLVMGWMNDPASNEITTTGEPQAINLANLSMPPQATTKVTFEGNLDDRLGVGESVPYTVSVFDAKGREHKLTYTFEKIAGNEWQYTVSAPAGLTAASGATGTISFDSRGRVASTDMPQLVITFDDGNTVDLNIQTSVTAEKFTQYSAEGNLKAAEVDGYKSGTLNQIQIDSNGCIIGIYSNGMYRIDAVLALASFTNPAGLEKIGDNLFAMSTNSGPAYLGTAGQDGRGTINPGTLEMSNVDLAKEFTDMITTQRGFQANSRIITTSDEMLQELVNLKR